MSASNANRNVGAVVFALVFPTVVTWTYFCLLSGRSATWQYTAYSVGKVIQFTFPVFWVCVIQRQRPHFQRPSSRGLGAGIAFGLCVLLAMLTAYHAILGPLGFFDPVSGLVQQRVRGLHIDSVFKFAVMGTFYAAAHSLLEEYYWRWFVFGQLRGCCGLGKAITLSSFGFMAHHVLVLGTYFGGLSASTVLFSLAVAVGGAFWAWLYDWSRSLYGPWISHALVDLAIFVVGYDMVRHELLP